MDVSNKLELMARSKNEWALKKFIFLIFGLFGTLLGIFDVLFEDVFSDHIIFIRLVCIVGLALTFLLYIGFQFFRHSISLKIDRVKLVWKMVIYWIEMEFCSSLFNLWNEKFSAVLLEIVTDEKVAKLHQNLFEYFDSYIETKVTAIDEKIY